MVCLQTCVDSPSAAGNARLTVRVEPASLEDDTASVEAQLCTVTVKRSWRDQSFALVGQYALFHSAAVELVVAPT